jgi:hypothetical protein
VEETYSSSSQNRTGGGGGGSRGLGPRQAFFINPGIATLKEDGDRTGEMMTNGPSIGPGIPCSKLSRYAVVGDLSDDLEGLRGPGTSGIENKRPKAEPSCLRVLTIFAHLESLVPPGGKEWGGGGRNRLWTTLGAEGWAMEMSTKYRFRPRWTSRSPRRRESS